MAEPAVASAVVVPGYTVAERIGAGGFGEVYRATHTMMGRAVAIKVLNAKYSADPEAVARFVAEARAASKISHPGIVDVFDFGTLADGRQYCVMELVRGETLRDVLRARERVPLAEALPILRGIAEAVDAAHGAGIAHRDLKPDNVFVTADGGVKLIDFGLAKLSAEDAPAVTETGAVFGTPLYMSPEQCRGKSIDARTDAYSFGVLAYHVLTGAPPFTGEALEIALQHLNEPPAPPSSRCAELDERVDRVLLALLAKDPDARPALLADAIAAIAGEAALPPAPPVTRTARRWPWIAGGVAIAGALAAVIALRMRDGTTSDAAVAKPACTPAHERLVGVWDEPRRAKLAAAYAAEHKPAVDATWRALADDLDGYSEKWSKQWDAACAAPDADPLLRAQREACLETALIDLRGIASAVASSKPAELAEGWNGDFGHASLADCANEKALRAQLPAPPVENRAQVAELIDAVHQQRREARQVLNAGRAGNLEGVFVKLDEIAGKLDALHSSAANMAWWFRGSYLQLTTSFQPQVRQRARLAVAKEIEHANATRDDAWLAAAYDTLARIELASGALDAAEKAIASADAALERSGNAATPARYIAITHARIDASRGRFDSGLERLKGIPVGDWRGAGIEVSDRVGLLLRAGRGAEAIAAQRAILAQQVKAFGEQHWMTAAHHATLANALDRTGDATGALSELASAISLYRALGASHVKLIPLYIEQLDLAVRVGNDKLATDAAAHIVRETGGPLSPTDWLNIVFAALDRGAVPTVRAVLSKLPTEPPTLVAIADEVRAAVAAIDGDAVTLERMAREPAQPLTARSSPSEIRVSLWLRALVDVANGQRKAAEARLALLAVAKTNADPVIAGRARMFEAIVMLAMGRYREASAALEATRAAPVYSRDHVLAQTDAWLGLARLYGGDPHGAIAPLEEALDVVDSCCSGMSWLVPGIEFGLARALWDGGGDRVRARRLVELAGAKTKELGLSGTNLVFRDIGIRSGEAWLATHTAAMAAEPIAPIDTGCPAPATPAARGKNVVFLATEGVKLTRGQLNDAPANTSPFLVAETLEVPAFQPGLPGRAANIAEIVAHLQRIYAPYSIDFVTTRPAKGPYRMVVLGGSPTLFNQPNSNVSLTPFDCSANAVSTVDFVFDFGDKPHTFEYARTIASDVGSMLGLGAVTEPTDCMCRGLPSCANTPEVCTFRPGVLDLAVTACDRPKQDERAMLKAALGCR